MHKLNSLGNVARNTASRNLKSQKSDLRAPLSTTISQSTANLFERCKKPPYPQLPPAHNFATQSSVTKRREKTVKMVKASSFLNSTEKINVPKN